MSIQIGFRPVFCLAVILTCSSAVDSQTAFDDLQIFAHAGHVNHVSGTVQVRPGPNGPAKALAGGDQLLPGIQVETGDNSQVEVLLNPGTFLRVAENSEFLILSAKLADLRILLRRGSFLIETGNEPNPSLRIQTPLGMAFVESKGIFRVNALPLETEFLSFGGNLILGSRKVNINEGQRVTVNHLGAGPVESFDTKSSRDTLANWSRERANYLAKANHNLDDAGLMSALNREANNAELNASLSGQTGFWAVSQQQGVTLFVPFFPETWRSPYGFQYSNGNVRRANTATRRPEDRQPMPATPPLPKAYSPPLVAPRRAWPP